MRSLGGVHPYLRQSACTSAPLVHLNSGWPTGIHGFVRLAFISLTSKKFAQLSVELRRFGHVDVHQYVLCGPHMCWRLPKR